MNAHKNEKIVIRKKRSIESKGKKSDDAVSFQDDFGYGGSNASRGVSASGKLMTRLAHVDQSQFEGADAKKVKVATKILPSV